jgi:hypothetical protein
MVVENKHWINIRARLTPGLNLHQCSYRRAEEAEEEEEGQRGEEAEIHHR